MDRRSKPHPIEFAIIAIIVIGLTVLGKIYLGG
jgi:hypothetical protein